ncbi:hypothetical protein N784_12465 [Pontibacillus litoralis JSM 072002]|uniref:Uncharacterized protein n=2 Tax=Pontibacillus TaxID=289201 RepID=A0A0A5GA19_9BACI|nr:hypothetical protein N784_12465 [Pontibacillus litoralis JSM 072002]
MVFLIILTVSLYSVLMVGILAKLQDKRAMQVVQFLRGNKAYSAKQKQQQYKELIATR